MASVLHGWYVNNFRQRVGDNTGHVGTGFPLAKKIGFAIDSWLHSPQRRQIRPGYPLRELREEGAPDSFLRQSRMHSGHTR